VNMISGVWPLLALSDTLRDTFSRNAGAEYYRPGVQPGDRRRSAGRRLG